MHSVRFLFVALLIAHLVALPGCGLLSKRRSEFDSLTRPVSYQVPVKPEPKPATGFVGKSKQAVGQAFKVVGLGVALVGFVVLKGWLDDDEDETEGFDPNPLWHQGYGFNNPNNERIRNGQPVLNFDGSVAED